jgi:rRNA maturation endonuclease Nob1
MSSRSWIDNINLESLTEDVMAYTCKTCGAVAKEPGHLCNPCGDKAKCSFCGAPAADAKHVCKDKLAAMKYVCDGCGRVAMEKEHLCKPAPIGK